MSSKKQIQSHKREQQQHFTTQQMSLCFWDVSSFGSSEHRNSAVSFCPSLAVWETNEQAHFTHLKLDTVMAPFTKFLLTYKVKKPALAGTRGLSCSELVAPHYIVGCFFYCHGERHEEHKSNADHYW